MSIPKIFHELYRHIQTSGVLFIQIPSLAHITRHAPELNMKDILKLFFQLYKFIHYSSIQII